MYTVTPKWRTIAPLLYCRWFQPLETNTNIYADGQYHVFYLLRADIFPAHWIYFYFSWGRHYYTTVSALLDHMGGTVWHYDGCELSSAISVLTQHSGRTSEVQVHPVIEYRCVRDHSKYKRTLLWSTLLEKKVQSVYIFIYLSTYKCMTKCCCFGSTVTQVIALTQRKKRKEQQSK